MMCRADPAPATSPWPAFVLAAARAHFVVVALVVVATVAGSVGTLALRSTYVATVELLVTPLPSDDANLLGLPLVRDLGDPVRTIETAAATMVNPVVAREAAATADEGWTTRRVLDAVEVVPRGQTDLLEVRAEASTARRATNLANAYADALLTVRGDAVRSTTEAAIAQTREQLGSRMGLDNAATALLEERLVELERIAAAGDPTVAIAERAPPPLTSSGPPAVLVLPLAVVLGLAIGATVAAVLESRRAD